MPRARKRKKFSELTKRSKYLIILTIIGIAAPMIIFAFAPINITRSWLTIEAGTFQDKNGNNLDHLRVVPGGYDLIDVDQEDSDLLAPDTVAYYFNVKFGWELLIYTDLGMYNVFNNLDLNHQRSERFLHYTHYNYDSPVTGYVKKEDNWYKGYWRTCDWSNWNSFDFDGHIPITMSIEDDLAPLNGQTLHNATIERADMVYTFIETLRSDITRGTCGDYEDIYTSIGPRELTVSVESVTEASTPTQSLVVGKINEWDLGVKVDGDSVYETIQNSLQESVQYTGHYSSAGPQSFNLEYRLRPEILKAQQTINVRRGKIRLDTGGFGNPSINLDPSYTAFESDTDYTRTTAVKVVNSYIHEEFETTVEIVATVQYDHELSETELSDPFFFQGDFVWDDGLDGGSSAEISYAGENIWDATIGVLLGQFFGSIFGQALMIIIIIGAIIGIIIVYKRFTSKRRLI